MELLNTLDWVIIALLLGGIVLGFIRGLISQLISIAGLFIAFVSAYLFYDDLAPWIEKIIPITSWESYKQYALIFNSFKLDVYFYNAVSFAVIFFGVKIALTLAGHFLNLVAKVPGLNLFNKWSGALLGLVEAVALIIVAVNVMEILPSETIQNLVAESYIADLIHEQIPNAAEKLHQLWNPES